jgi:methionyl-tRNA formyltransferase
MLAAMPDRTPDGIVYFGTPEVSARCLQVLIDSGVRVDLVVTGPAKRRGRGSALVTTSVHAVADRYGIPVVHDFEGVTSVMDHRGGKWLGIVVAYGRIIPPSVLSRLPLVNLHFSLLPRWRGAAPVERAILAGDTETGICVMRIEEGLDEGATFSRISVPIDEREDADSLRERLCLLGSQEMVRLLKDGFPRPVPQSGDVTYAHKITKEERRIVWTASVEVVSRLVRIGGAYTSFEGERMRVVVARPADAPMPTPGLVSGEIRLLERAVAVACDDGLLVLEALQPAGKKEMDAASWWNGVPSTLASAGKTVRFE